MLEAMRVQNNSMNLTIDLQVQLPDWELYIIKMARSLMEEQSPQRLLMAREMLYNLLTNCIPPDVILQTLMRELMLNVDDTIKHELAHWAAYVDLDLWGVTLSSVMLLLLSYFISSGALGSHADLLLSYSMIALP